MMDSRFRRELVNNKLSIERKWIVTGTPTSNILGLGLGRKQDEDIENDISIDSTYSLPPMTDCSASATSSISDSSMRNIVREWGTYDYVNLRKLGAMISDFLAVPQFDSDLKLSGSHVSSPLCDPHGPRVGAVKVLSQIMDMVMSYNALQASIAINAIDSECKGQDSLHLALEQWVAIQSGPVSGVRDWCASSAMMDILKQK
ncbi:uncharacterized protein F5147DRAFT_652770 [Suillus discolor]|uniref:Uncharacterized protein n=1 Tax=Suillus discolor TaxID=1912936 RepID=A0A9P7F6D2_9AGAM|nr:uncharacterized protein F5147DRAFT_652770 [Suillus discolor]KAG2108390.1 hypothetical protein F5147DRAFT_652770 [Suillus discolor]